jgi:hypothetical protein
VMSPVRVRQTSGFFGITGGLHCLSLRQLLKLSDPMWAQLIPGSDSYHVDTNNQFAK